MTPLERLVTDIQGTDLSIGPHPVAFYRDLLNRRGVVPARDLAQFEHDRPVRVAGAVICRQRPGTAKGFLFLTLEDETGLVNAIVKPKIFERYRDVLLRARLLEIDGIVQAKEGITVRAVAVRAVETEAPPPELPARNFC
jgi:error-prone DNA polymerase